MQKGEVKNKMEETVINKKPSSPTVKKDFWVVIVGLFCLTILELYALSKGINGIILSGVFAIIACAIGVMIPKEKLFRN